MPTATRAPATATDRPLAGRVALVTGASAGIGAEFARLLAERGADVALVARREERLQALAAELRRAHGVRAVAIGADLADPAAPERIIAECAHALGAPDILVNNAGYGPREGCLDAPWCETEEFLRVMVTSYVELTVRAVPAMRARGYGRVIQVSSLASFAPETRGSLYGPAKRFLTSFARAVALELEGTGVHISASCPGFTRTEFHDVMGNRSHMERLPSWMWSTSRQVAEASWRAVDAGRPVVIVGALNRFIAFLAWLLPRWAMNAISPRAVVARREAAVAAARGDAGANAGRPPRRAPGGASGGGGAALALAGAVAWLGMAPVAGTAALCGAACVPGCRAPGGSGAQGGPWSPGASGAPGEAARDGRGGDGPPADARAAAGDDRAQLAEALPLVYLNLAAVVAGTAPLSEEAIADLGAVLPAVKAACEAGGAVDWPSTRARLLADGAHLGARLGMATPSARRNAGLLLPPEARVTWAMRAIPAPEARRSSAESAYRLAPGGEVRIECGARTLVFPVRAGALALAGAEDAPAGERIAELERMDLALQSPSGAPVEIALAEGSPSRAVLFKADGTGLVTAAFVLRSADPEFQRYFDLFGPVRLTLDFALREGALDFAAAGALPALLVAPSELPLEPGRDECADVPAPDWRARPGPGGTPEAARPGGGAWTNAQIEILRTYCALRADMRAR
jgi:short-subunit dehydrogenase